MKNPQDYKPEKLFKPDDIKWVMVDLDQTLAKKIHPEPGIGEPIEGAKEMLEMIRDNGDKIIIYTARPYYHYRAIEKWLEDNNMPYRRIVCGKVMGKVLIDDRAYRFEENEDGERGWDDDKIKEVKKII